jgi:hypothetical protein
MPDNQPRALPNRSATLLMAMLLAIGLYFPTSHGEVISIPLYLFTAASLFSILILLLLRRRGILGPFAVLNAAALNVILLLCTLFSPFTQIAYGGYVPVVLFSLLFCVSVKDVRLTATTRTLFNAANGINIGLAALLLLHVESVTQFFLANYAFGYDDLVVNMLSENKPVLTFGSHSLAGFFYYLLFYLTFQTFAKTGSKLNLVYAVCYVALLTSLFSFTAVVFTAVAVVQLVLHFQWHKAPLAGLAATGVLFAGVVFVAPRLTVLDNFNNDIQDVLRREENGLAGRYSSSGGLAADLDYIASHPLKPIGLGLSHELWYSDSGPVEYFLKGSLPLLLTVYTGAFLFFRRNLKSKHQSLFVFLVFLSFELGFSNLQYFRTQCLLPFLVVYLNGLEKQAPFPVAQAALRQAAARSSSEQRLIAEPVTRNRDW